MFSNRNVHVQARCLRKHKGSGRCRTDRRQANIHDMLLESTSPMPLLPDTLFVNPRFCMKAHTFCRPFPQVVGHLVSKTQNHPTRSLCFPKHGCVFTFKEPTCLNCCIAHTCCIKHVLLLAYFIRHFLFAQSRPKRVCFKNVCLPST